MRSVFIAPSPLEGYVFINTEGEKFLITNSGFAVTKIETDDLEQVSFDIAVQAVMDNALTLIDQASEEIKEAIQNFE